MKEGQFFVHNHDFSFLLLSTIITRNVCGRVEACVKEKRFPLFSSLLCSLSAFLPLLWYDDGRTGLRALKSP